MAFTHSATGLSAATNTGTAVRLVEAPPPPLPRSRGRSAPRSPASTSGPHITAVRRGLSDNGSKESAFGNTTLTVSPLFQVRFNSTKELALRDGGPLWLRRNPPRPPAASLRPGLMTSSLTVSSLTLTAKPSPAQYGRRNAIVNCFGD